MVNYRFFRTCSLVFFLLGMVFFTSHCALFRWLKKVPPIPPIVSVQIIPSIDTIILQADSEIVIKEPETEKVLKTLDGKSSVIVKMSGGSLYLGQYKVPQNTFILDAPKSTFLRVNNNKYRGQLEISRLSSKQFQVVNVLDIESYLYGVVPREVSASWPMEALKAQAVAARTYAIHELLHRRYGGYDLKATVESQVYGGANAETERTNQAIDETRDLVMAYDDEIVAAYFHSTCGGRTEDDAEIWSGADLPYLNDHKCKYCKASPHYTWESEMDRDDLRAALKKIDRDPGKIYWVKTKKTKTKRVRQIIIKGTRGKEKFTDNEFRSVWGKNRIKSRRYTTKNRFGGIQVQGNGWGHAVGLCQWGARGMAEEGHDFREILHYYYGGWLFNRISIKPYKKIKEIKVFMGNKAK